MNTPVTTGISRSKNNNFVQCTRCRRAAAILRRLLIHLESTAVLRSFTEVGIVRDTRQIEMTTCIPSIIPFSFYKENNIPSYLCTASCFLSSFIHSTSTNRPASQAFFAAFCSASISPLISHMPLKMASLPSFFSNSYGCPYSTTQPLSSTNTLS